MATTALKEWAVAVKALGEGRQVLLVRKGGVGEETRDFRVRKDRFLLFPTLEHQRPELLQPAFQPDLQAMLARPRPAGKIPIDTFAELTNVFEVTERWQVEALTEHYCWSLAYAEERLRWRPRKPLLVMAVRAYLLPEPVWIASRNEYGGCKSWVELANDVPIDGRRPAIDDAEYGARIASIKLALERQPIGTG